MYKTEAHMDGIVNILYHCNDEKRCQQFVNDEIDLIEFNNDKYWLGKGMYFWDNRGNAKYWMKEKKKKDKRNNNFSIIQAKVSLDTILDLTDKEISNQIIFLWELYKKSINLNEKEFCGKLGVILDIMFSEIEIMKQYQSIKVFGLYSHENNTLFFNKHLKGPKVSNAGKLVYLVKDKSIILEKEIYESCEVI